MQTLGSLGWEGRAAAPRGVGGLVRGVGRPGEESGTRRPSSLSVR